METTKRKRSRFTPEFKAEVVIEALSGQSSPAELCRHHNLTAEQLSQWKRQLLENAASLFESSDKQSDASTARIAQLEQLVERLTQIVNIHKKNLGETPKQNTGLRQTRLKNDDRLGYSRLIVRCERFVGNLV